MSDALDRRTFLAHAARLGGGSLLAPSLLALSSCSDATGPLPTSSGYGPLARSVDVPELWIPEGFSVQRLSTTLVASAADPAFTVPYGMDGMAAFSLPGGAIRLIRNHEIRDAPGTVPVLGNAAPAYDAATGGGTVSLELQRRQDGGLMVTAEFVSLAGTHTNCAGGPSPWNTWISCEETTIGPAAGATAPHGYCFEVAADARGPVIPVPLNALGRFTHEALAIDPRDGAVYLTEDVAFDAAALPVRGAGFYRFLPDTPGDLSAGRLQMLAVRSAPNYVTHRDQAVAAAIPVEWVDIDDPDPEDADVNPSAVFHQGWQRGGAAFERLEGCWYGGGRVYFNATSGGNARAGQVWSYEPFADGTGALMLLFESPSPEVLDRPDNLCVSPRGGLALCEDGGGIQFIRGLTDDGRLFDLVRTHANATEFAGACFSPDGEVFFFNLQGGTRARQAGAGEGGTYALWGPWANGDL